MEMKDISPGERKVNEYIARIDDGESKEAILGGLPESFRRSIEKGLAQNEGSAEIKKEIFLTVPPQYEGLPSDVLEEIWTIPVYVDDEKTKKENERKRLAIENLRKKEAETNEIFEKEISDRERIEELRKKIQQPEQSEQAEKNLISNLFLCPMERLTLECFGINIEMQLPKN